MTSMKGSRTWKPASSTALNFPSRSTTKAACCGTTVAVFTTTMTARTATTMAMSSAAFTVRPFVRSSLGPQEERQPLDPDHAAAPPPRERLAALGARLPGGAAQLGAPRPPGRDVVERRGHLAHQLRLQARSAELAPQPLAQRHQQRDREDDEEAPLEPAGPAGLQRHQHADRQGADAEEEGEEPPRRRQLDDQQRHAHQDPGPPGHAGPSPGDASTPPGRRGARGGPGSRTG